MSVKETALPWCLGMVVERGEQPWYCPKCEALEILDVPEDVEPHYAPEIMALVGMAHRKCCPDCKTKTLFVLSPGSGYNLQIGLLKGYVRQCFLLDNLHRVWRTLVVLSVLFLVFHV